MGVVSSQALHMLPSKVILALVVRQLDVLDRNVVRVNAQSAAKLSIRARQTEIDSGEIGDFDVGPGTLTSKFIGVIIDSKAKSPDRPNEVTANQNLICCSAGLIVRLDLCPHT